MAMQLGKKPKKAAQPAGMALAMLAGEDKDPGSQLSFEEMLGSQQFEKYRPVDTEAVNKGVEQFRGHIKTVFHSGTSAELDEFIGCMGFSEEEIRKWEKEERAAEETAARGSRLTNEAERAIREAEQRRKQERERAEKEMAMQRGRLQQQSEALQQARERAQQKGGAPMPGKGMKGGPMKGKGPPGKGMPMPGKGPQAVKGGPKGGKGMPPPGVGLAPRGPPGKGLPGMMPKQAPAKPPPGAPQQAQAPGAPVDATPPAAKPQAPGDAAAGTPAKPAPKTGSEQIAQKSEAFMAEVKAKPVKITKKDIEKHAAQLEGEVAKMRAKVSSELNDRYRKAVAETNTLEDVRKELSVVDQIIAADVAVIRENIDVATGELSDAQKRFDSAEEEFIAAKLELKMCEEFKTELTEYLTMLIQENQKKKSAKLEELSATLRAGGQLTEANQTLLERENQAAAEAAQMQVEAAEKMAAQAPAPEDEDDSEPNTSPTTDGQ